MTNGDDANDESVAKTRMTKSSAAALGRRAGGR
jgi:hypothetical protein